MMAVFSTTQFTERNAAFLPEENRAFFAKSDHWVKAKITGYNIQEKALNEKIKARKTKEGGDAKLGNNGLDPAMKILSPG